MISKKSSNKISSEYFKILCNYFGIAVHSNLSESISMNSPRLTFIDIEVFFLSSTYNLETSRLTEGLLCWLLNYGHLLSPSKVRRLILAGEIYDSAVLGGLIEFLIEQKIHANQWKIVLPYCRKRKIAKPLLSGPTPRITASYFFKYRIIAPNFKLDTSKLLYPETTTYKNCMELKNRALFGSVVNADLACCLKKHPNCTPYQASKLTHHHKARVFEIFSDIANSMT